MNDMAVLQRHAALQCLHMLLTLTFLLSSSMLKFQAVVGSVFCDKMLLQVTYAWPTGIRHSLLFETRRARRGER